MDIVIGVDVEGKLFQKENINSVVALLNQIMSYQMYSKTDEEIKQLDVYIHPDIQDYTVVDFGKKDEILEKGNSIAKEYTKVFEEIAVKQLVKRKRKLIRNTSFSNYTNVKTVNFSTDGHTNQNRLTKNSTKVTTKSLMMELRQH